ncbi:hypothetical protein HYPSUDRAFT_202852 [Hypholoma sublateritium FD-334 SS-4]|uniref:Uncharacterized protein n=1 Tax=Hypholoma sublateritium (strain FD-334 SS-4) TaxID=945553 RepID=A0A0D2NYC7_HYPSF|nr:hypothetical protein HYPSUDRAFT_202852 [Hypholoma sublateritium FD-334 SS-4]
MRETPQSNARRAQKRVQRTDATNNANTRIDIHNPQRCAPQPRVGVPNAAEARSLSAEADAANNAITRIDVPSSVRRATDPALRPQEPDNTTPAVCVRSTRNQSRTHGTVERCAVRGGERRAARHPARCASSRVHGKISINSAPPRHGARTPSGDYLASADSPKAN